MAEQQTKLRWAPRLWGQPPLGLAIIIGDLGDDWGRRADKDARPGLVSGQWLQAWAWAKGKQGLCSDRETRDERRESRAPQSLRQTAQTVAAENPALAL